jgi:hypothetical protein
VSDSSIFRGLKPRSEKSAVIHTFLNFPLNFFEKAWFFNTYQFSGLIEFGRKLRCPFCASLVALLLCGLFDWYFISIDIYINKIRYILDRLSKIIANMVKVHFDVITAAGG